MITFTSLYLVYDYNYFYYFFENFDVKLEGINLYFCWAVSTKKTHQFVSLLNLLQTKISLHHFFGCVSCIMITSNYACTFTRYGRSSHNSLLGIISVPVFSNFTLLIIMPATKYTMTIMKKLWWKDKCCKYCYAIEYR